MTNEYIYHLTGEQLRAMITLAIEKYMPHRDEIDLAVEAALNETVVVYQYRELSSDDLLRLGTCDSCELPGMDAPFASRCEYELFANGVSVAMVCNHHLPPNASPLDDAKRLDNSLPYLDEDIFKEGDDEGCPECGNTEDIEELDNDWLRCLTCGHKWNMYTYNDIPFNGEPIPQPDNGDNVSPASLGIEPLF